MKKNKSKNFFESHYFEVFCRVLEKDDVSERVDFFKGKFGVPVCNELSFNTKEAFEKKKLPDYFFEKTDLIYSIISAYKLPDNPYLIEEIIMYGNNHDQYEISPYIPTDLCFISAESDEKVLRYTLQREDENFLKILISPYASSMDLESFIKKYWRAIKDKLEKMVPDRYEKIEINKDRAIDNFIYHINTCRKRDLESYIKRTWPNDGSRIFDEKSVIISHLLKKMYDVSFSDSKVTRLLKQEKKRRKLGMLDTPHRTDLTKN